MVTLSVPGTVRNFIASVVLCIATGSRKGEDEEGRNPRRTASTELYMRGTL